MKQFFLFPTILLSLALISCTTTVTKTREVPRYVEEEVPVGEETYYETIKIPGTEEEKEVLKTKTIYETKRVQKGTVKEEYEEKQVHWLPILVIVLLSALYI